MFAGQTPRMWLAIRNSIRGVGHDDGDDGDGVDDGDDGGDGDDGACQQQEQLL